MSFLKKIKELLSDTRPPLPDDLVRLNTYPNVELAAIDKGCLEANGIHAMLENTGENYTPQIKTGVGLVVFYRDYEQARQLLHLH